MTVVEATSGSEQETEQLGAALASLLRAGDVVLVSGELGAGKTTLVRGMAAGLGFGGDVTSPTFTLVHRYPGSLDLVHVDLWRLERLSEIEDLALDEDLDAGHLGERGSAVVAEWGEAAATLLGNRALVVKMAVGGNPGERRLAFEAAGEHWTGRAGALREALEGAVP